jgi:integrase/recombinase XerD
VYPLVPFNPEVPIVREALFELCSPKNVVKCAEDEHYKLRFNSYPNIYKGSLPSHFMLYNTEANFEGARRRIDYLEKEEDIEVILKFLDQLYAEGLSKPRVLKYANHLKTMSERMEKSFVDAEKEDITAFLSQLEQSDYAPHTKRDYRIVVKRLFEFLEKKELVKNVKTTLKGNKKKLPAEIFTKAEVRKMIEAAGHPRNKAIVAMLYEGGLRIGELASLKIKNVAFDEYGAVIKVRGKTGERVVRVVSSASLVAQWLEMHPRREDEEAPLWVNLSTNYKKEGITYQGIAQNLKRIARKAGVKKKVTPHIFRHSRATHLAKKLTEAEMNVYFGWVQGSDMPATYVHLSGRDVDDKILQLHNLKPRERDREDVLRAKQCPRCKYINAPVNRYCGRCGTVLDEGERLKLEMKSRTMSKDFPDLTIEDTDLLEKMKEFRDMLELFEKHPELFSSMRAMVEGRS